MINDGSTTLEDQLGAVADLELAIRSRKLEDDIIVVLRMRLLRFDLLITFNWTLIQKSLFFLCGQIAGDMLCADQNFDIAQVIRFFKSKVIIIFGRRCNFVEMKSCST